MPRNADQLRFSSVILLSLAFASTAFSQRVYTVAGGFVGDGGPATLASLSDPQCAAFRCARKSVHRRHRE